MAGADAPAFANDVNPMGGVGLSVEPFQRLYAGIYRPKLRSQPLQDPVLRLKCAVLFSRDRQERYLPILEVTYRTFNIGELAVHRI